MTALKSKAKHAARRPRRALALALELDTADKRGRMGVLRNVSESGLLLNTPTRLEPGAPVTVRVHLRDGQSTTLHANVARVEACGAASPEPWRYHVALHWPSPVTAGVQPLLALAS